MEDGDRISHINYKRFNNYKGMTVQSQRVVAGLMSKKNSIEKRTVLFFLSSFVCLAILRVYKNVPYDDDKSRDGKAKVANRSLWWQ